MPFRTARWHAGWPGPGAHCAPIKALVVITAPLPSPPVPAFREARPITWKLACVRRPGGIGDRHPDRSAQPGPDGAHRGHAEHDVPVAVGQAAVHGRQQGGTADRGHHDRTHVLAVDVDLDERAQRYLADGAVPAQAVQQRPGDLGLRSGQPVAAEIGLERRAVQRGRGHQVGQAGPEDGGRAQRGHRHHHAEQRRSHGLSVPAPFERVPDPDQSGSGQAGQGCGPAHRRHHRRRRRRVSARRPGLAHRWPGRDGDHGGQHGQRAEREDDRIEGHRAG